MGDSPSKSQEPLRPAAPLLSCSGGALLVVLVLLALPAAWGETRAGVGSGPSGQSSRWMCGSWGFVFRGLSLREREGKGVRSSGMPSVYPDPPCLRLKAVFPSAGSCVIPRAEESADAKAVPREMPSLPVVRLRD